MTDTITKPEPGEQGHWLRSGVTFSSDDGPSGRSVISRRADTFTLSASLIEANTDRSGRSLFDLLHDPDGQLARWGYVIMAPGPADGSVTRWTPGSAEQEEARDEARKLAHGLPDGPEKLAALAEVRETYGAAPTSRTLARVVGDAERARMLQEYLNS